MYMDIYARILGSNIVFNALTLKTEAVGLMASEEMLCVRIQPIPEVSLLVSFSNLTT